MTGALLEIAALSAGYGLVPVLSEVGLVIRAGEIVTLVGSNGAGKTTLLRAVSRLIQARGTLRFDGRDLNPLAPEQVFDREPLPPGIRVAVRWEPHDAHPLA